jgi:hypothetical protein
MNGDYAMLSYGEVDGVRNHRDSEIRALFERVVQEGGGHVFRDGTIPDAAAFIRVARMPSVAFYVLYVRGEVAGACWLNRFQCRFAQLHFFAFRKFWGRDALGLGRHVLRELLYMTVPDGGYLLDMLLGIVPADNRFAVAFTQRCGGKLAGVLPRGSLDAAKGRSGPAVIITVTREDV